MYVREAHPTDEWQMKSNVKDDVCYAQPKNLKQRVDIANDFITRFKYPLPFGVDDMSNAAENAYSAWPERLYVIDEQGRIAYRGGMGPFNYDPKELRGWLSARYGEVKHEDPKHEDPKHEDPMHEGPKLSDPKQDDPKLDNQNHKDKKADPAKTL